MDNTFRTPSLTGEKDEIIMPSVDIPNTDSKKLRLLEMRYSGPLPDIHPPEQVIRSDFTAGVASPMSPPSQFEEEHADDKNPSEEEANEVFFSTFY
jgi:hypothetical protein